MFDKSRETRSLIKTLGNIDIINIIQHRSHPDQATYIGSGKIEELRQIIGNKRIAIVIINDLVNHGQLCRLTQALWPTNRQIRVWDRIDLILNIFDKHANTAEAKVQIEIARMRHMGPQIYGLGGTYFSRQGAGIGTRGLGETNIELMKRHWRNQIKKKTEELKRLIVHRQQQLDRRKQNGLQTVSIVGYTNAGKTSLFNLLTKKNKAVKNALFVTLDSTTGKLFLPKLKEEIIVTDTIGFIQDLPPTLVDAFRSTLLESVNADLVVHLIDVDDEKRDNKIEIVNEILSGIGSLKNKQLFVFNKSDTLDKKQKKQLTHNYHYLNPIFISVKENVGIEQLIERVEKELF